MKLIIDCWVTETNFISREDLPALRAKIREEGAILLKVEPIEMGWVKVISKVNYGKR